MAVGWYLRFSLSYRDVEELLAERGLHADHVTVWRWVQRYAPEVNRRLRSSRPMTVGGWTRPTYGSRASGCIYTGCGFEQCDDRLPSLGQTRCSSG